MIFAPISIFVRGEPKGQPRPRAFAMKFGDKWSARVFDAGTAEGWKSAIAEEWRRSAPAMPKITTPVSVTLKFYMPRPKAHFGARGIKPNAPTWFTQKPDADNLAKAVLDCLTQLNIWSDDSLVVILVVAKKFAETDLSGCRIEIKDASLAVAVPEQLELTGDR